MEKSVTQSVSSSWALYCPWCPLFKRLMGWSYWAAQGSHINSGTVGMQAAEGSGFQVSNNQESSGAFVTMLKSYLLSCYLSLTAQKISGNITFHLAHTPVRRGTLFTLIPNSFKTKVGWGRVYRLSCLWCITTYWDPPIRCSLMTTWIRKKVYHRTVSFFLTFTTSSSSLLAACCFSSLVLNWEQIYEKEKSYFTKK